MQPASRLRKKLMQRAYEQILWLDGVHRKYVEEVGTSNAFFVIGDEVSNSSTGWNDPAGYYEKLRNR